MAPHILDFDICLEMMQKPPSLSVTIAVSYSELLVGQAPEAKFRDKRIPGAQLCLAKISPANFSKGSFSEFHQETFELHRHSLVTGRVSLCESAGSSHKVGVELFITIGIFPLYFRLKIMSSFLMALTVFGMNFLLCRASPQIEAHPILPTVGFVSFPLFCSQ